MMTETSEFNFEQCIKCTVCTVYCPVAAVNPLYPGPKQAGPDGERLRLKRPEFFNLRVHSLQIGNIAFVGYPGEPFTKIGT